MVKRILLTATVLLTAVGFVGSTVAAPMADPAPATATPAKKAPAKKKTKKKKASNPEFKKDTKQKGSGG